MLDKLIEMFSYPFMVRAILVGTMVSLCSALLGVSLVLKRYSMIGDGLSHVGFGALAIAAAANAAPLAVAIPVVVLAAVLLLRISGTLLSLRQRIGSTIFCPMTSSCIRCTRRFRLSM